MRQGSGAEQTYHAGGKGSLLDGPEVGHPSERTSGGVHREISNRVARGKGRNGQGLTGAEPSDR